MDYVIGASAGQHMKVDMSTDNTANYFNVMEPDETEVAIFNGSVSDNRFEGTLAKSGDYRLRVYLMRSAARRNERASYRLSITITAVTGQQAAMEDPRADMSPLKQVAEPSDIADIIAMLVSRQGHWITAQNIFATGGAISNI